MSFPNECFKYWFSIGFLIVKNVLLTKISLEMQSSVNIGGLTTVCMYMMCAILPKKVGIVTDESLRQAADEKLIDDEFYIYLVKSTTT